jgi:hypothetical protein
MLYPVTHDINPTKVFFTVQNALRMSKMLDDVTCTTLYRISRKKKKQEYDVQNTNINSFAWCSRRIFFLSFFLSFFFFTKYTTLGTFFLTCPARTSLKYYEKCKNYGKNFHCVFMNCTVFITTMLIMSHMISGNVFRPPVSLITHTGQWLWEVGIEIYLRLRVRHNCHENQVWSTVRKDSKEIL